MTLKHNSLEGTDSASDGLSETASIGGKQVDNWYEAIYSNDNPETPAHGWIQWKGTDVCVDLHCICGTHGHIDGDFMYSVKCKDCGRKYAVGQNIKLIPLDTPDLVEAGEKYHEDYYLFSDEDNDPEAGMKVTDLQPLDSEATDE